VALVPLDQARALVLEACGPLPAVEVPLAAALGCISSEPVVSAESVPPFANTAMDGYAVRAADTAAAPVRLRVVGTLPAGTAPTTPVGPGEAIRIMTGAPVPEGADAIVMVERTLLEVDGSEVTVEVAARPGDHVRPAGDDIRPGQEVVTAGTLLGAGHLGVLASVGVDRVRVHRRPRVGVLSTGDELVTGAGPLAPGQIRDSNRVALLALLHGAGCEGVDLGVVADDEAAIAAAIRAGVTDCDALLTSGGVSVGDYDYVKAVLDGLGDMRWMQVAIKPAKPFAFGTVEGVPVFGLPGNPVSSMVSFELFARPALRRMQGHAEAVPPGVPAVAGEDLPRRPDGKTHFARVVLRLGPDGRHHARSAGGQGSHQLAAMAAANALAVLPDGDGVAAGQVVTVLPLGGGVTGP
jgi:molybdopterin molybdotransferase